MTFVPLIFCSSPGSARGEACKNAHATRRDMHTLSQTRTHALAELEHRTAVPGHHNSQCGGPRGDIPHAIGHTCKEGVTSNAGGAFPAGLGALPSESQGFRVQKWCKTHKERLKCGTSPHQRSRSGREREKTVCALAATSTTQRNTGNIETSRSASGKFW